MERRIINKVDNHQRCFKDALREWMTNNEMKVVTNTNIDATGDFMRYLYDYTKLELTSDDFKRRKRVTNTIPLSERCIAKRACGDQCTRRKKEGHTYCGTHIKGAPHGIVEKNEVNTLKKVKIDIHVEEIKGIQYYLDSSGNVYKPEDIILNCPNPTILAKWTQDEKGNYHIPELNI